MPKMTNEKLSKSNKIKKKANKKLNDQGNTKDEKFSFDDEIVIGLKRIDEPSKQTNKAVNKKKKNNKKSSKKIVKNNVKKEKANENIADEPSILIKSKYMSNYEDDEENEKTKSNINANNRNKKIVKRKKTNENSKQPKKSTKKIKKRRRIVLKVFKGVTLLCIIIGGIVYAMLSPIFNIQSITVSGNSKISSETIVSLSGLVIDQNIFSFSTGNIIDNIKQNAYIDTVDIRRKFPDTVEITVQERTATYMLTYGNAYVYINNQGYILEITSEKGDYPIITGYETPTDQIVEGNRLDTADLEKLNDVLKIMEAIASGGDEIVGLITQIDISDNTNYILTLSKQKKTIYLGDATNLSTKVLWINKFIEEEEKNEGTIYLNVNLNSDMPYFREKV